MDFALLTSQAVINFTKCVCSNPGKCLRKICEGGYLCEVMSAIIIVDVMFLVINIISISTVK